MRKHKVGQVSFKAAFCIKLFVVVASNFTTLNVGSHRIAISFGISTVRGVFTCVSIFMLHILDVVAGKQYDIE